MKKIYLFLMLCLCSYITRAQFDFENIQLLDTYDDPSVQAEPVYGIRYQSCWGWADTVNGGEYGIIGSTAGTYIIDVTDPSNISLADYVPHRLTTSIWHEYKTYENYLYVISDDGGNNSLQIVDLSYLPDSVHVIYDDDDLFVHAHTLYIDGERLYVASVTKNFNYSSMNLYSLANPASPVLIRRLDQDFPGINQVHDMYVVNDTIFASCANQGLFIFKYDEGQDKFIQLGSLTTYPDQGYNHSSFLSKDHSTLYMCDEVPAGLATKIVDVTDISNPTVVDTFYTNPGCTPHNPYVKGDYLYLAAYQDGMWIYDISNPTVPVRKGYFDTYPTNPPGVYLSPAYAGCWAVYTDLPSGTIIASDMQLGLFTFDVSAATSIAGIDARDKFSLYPNPATETVSISGIHGNLLEVSLNDITGKLVRTFSAGDVRHNVVSVRGLDNGIYMITVKTSEGKFTDRVVISR